MRGIILLGALFAVAGASAGYAGLAPSGVDFAGKKGEAVEKKRFDTKLWGEGSRSGLSDKRFRIEEWDKHYSSIGKKRAPIAVKEGETKKMFRSSTKRFQEINYGMSRWNRELADLHEQAGIETSERAFRIAERRVYESAVADAEPFRERGEALSLRDINRYQFRRNRAQGEIPVQRAAGSE